MGSSLNFIGVIAWLVLICWFVFVIHDIRRRHLKMIVVDKKRFSYFGTIVDMIEILILIAGFLFMNSITFFHHVDVNDKEQIKVSYQYKPLVIQTKGATGHFVVKENNGRTSTDKYTYWVKNAKYSVTSRDATLINSESDLKDSTIANHPWDKKELLKQNKEHQGAFVATLKAEYKNTFINGLGMHAGRKATEYCLIKIPNSIFVLDK